MVTGLEYDIIDNISYVNSCLYDIMHNFIHWAPRPGRGPRPRAYRD